MDFEPDRYAFGFTTAHILNTTGNAYDASNCSDRIEIGDVLIIPSEKVIGVASAWPVAITTEHGNIHTFSGPTEALPKFCQDLGIRLDQLTTAAKVAAMLGYEIDPQFRHLLDKT